MSFSSDVKEELSKTVPQARHCQLAELSAIISMCGRVLIDEKEEYQIRIHTENVFVARKYFTLIRKSFNIKAGVSVRRSQKNRKSCLYTVAISDREVARNILQATRLIDENQEIREDLSLRSNQVIRMECCRRAFLRGAFLSTGSISDPEKSYHLEIVCTTEHKAVQLLEILARFGLEGKQVLRKNNHVVYLKEGSQIVDFLNIIGAHVALMEMENIRIVKDIRNSVNRKINCEMANITKTVTAANKQVADIEFLAGKIGLDALPENLKEIAKLRLEYPDATLMELGQYLSPPVGKSGVNHRLRRLSDMARELQEH